MKIIIIIVAIIIALVGFDLALTLFAATVGTGDGTESEWQQFRISFWSGLAYSAWIGTILAVVAGMVIWALEDTFRRRWQAAQETDRMMTDAVYAINRLYEEFPPKPRIYVSENGTTFGNPDDLTDQEMLRPALYTNHPEAARQRQAEYEQAVRQITDSIVIDRALQCAPPVASRIFNRFNKVSRDIWQRDSPLTCDPFLSTWVVQFMTAYRSLRSVSNHMDYLLRYHVRRQNKTAAPDSYEDEADRCFYFGTILQVDQATLMQMLAPNDKEEQAKLIAHHNWLRSIHNLERLVDPYAQGMQKIQSMLLQIQESPRTAPMHYRGRYFGHLFSEPPWESD